MNLTACKHLAPILLASLAALPGCPAQAREADAPYEAYLWIDGGFPLDAPAIGRLRALGITGIDAEGVAGVKRAAGSGLRFYVDHAVPKGFLHVRPKDFEEARGRWRRDPTPGNLVRPVCLRDPAALARATSDLRATLEECATHQPSFVSFTDEPSVTRGVSPIDWCRDAHCAAAFPRFLADRWGSEELARKVWGARWPKGEAPVPVDTDEVRRAVLHGMGQLDTLVRWSDTRAFADAGLEGAFKALAAEARRVRPGVKLALLGASMPSAFGGFDWEALGPVFDVIEPYDWGSNRDLARSASPRADLFQTLTTRDASPSEIRHDLWRGFLRGDRGVILFDASSWAGAASRPARPAIEEIAPLLRLFASPALAPWRRAAPLRPQVAILHGMPSTRLHWILDTRFDGASWVNRLTSYETAESSEALNREAWAALLSDLGISYKFVTPQKLRDGSLLDDGTIALVLPRAIAMSDSEVAAIATFATHHMVIADCQLGLFNARLQQRAKPALDELFGIRRPPVRGIDDIVADDAPPRAGALVPAEARVRVDGATAIQIVGTTPIFIVHGPGATRSVYLNVRIGSYVKNRLAQPEAAERLRAALRPLFVSSGVRPRVEATQLSGGMRWPIAVIGGKDGDDLLVAVEISLKTGARPIAWSDAIASARVRLRLTFPGTYQTTDVLSGQDLGSRNSVEVEIGATEPALLRLRP